MDLRLAALERQASSDPGDQGLQLELATAYGRSGRPRRAYELLRAQEVAPPAELLRALAEEQHLLLRGLGAIDAQVACERARWGWQWRDLGGHLARPAEAPVRALNLSGQRLGPAQLDRVAALITLRWLGLSGIDLLGRLRLLASLVELEGLELSYTDLRDPQLSLLRPFRALRRLSLANCSDLSGAGLAELRAPLEVLDLRLTNADDETLEVLTRFPTLVELTLLDCQRVSDHGLEVLARLPALRRLDLSFCHGVSGAGVEHLRQLRPELEVTR